MIVTLYALKCDRPTSEDCSEYGPSRSLPGSARILAELDGWRRVTITDGAATRRVDICPPCQPAGAAPSEETTS